MTAHPPVDPQLQATLDQRALDTPASLTPELIDPVREMDRGEPPPPAMLAMLTALDVTERKVPGPDGQPDVSLLILRPKQKQLGHSAATAHSPAATNSTESRHSTATAHSTETGDLLPGVFFVHGGGMVLGDHRFGLEICAEWFDRLDVVVVSVEYRLAPEHPHPAPSEDCYAGLTWTAAHASELGIDASKLVVAGSSAGGGLAAALALMARDRGGPELIGQLLVCPMLDDRCQTPSSQEFEGEGVWDRISNDTGWNALLGDQRGAPAVSPYAAPARAQDLSGLPPAFIDVGSAETFRDEDVEYAVRIWQAGGQAELHVWPGGFHSFDQIARDADLSVLARSVRADWLGRLLSATN